ncbi:hypothetical protein [Aliihoeflea sp. 2WW]|uniref:hypothetical protein n=1 Tax=Aliihoeflea sp. 2WW TaxID=1381123 RepID=UPI00126921A0|nr:hypothetical protein [Aliihoeflea sp. 2WW]
MKTILDEADRHRIIDRIVDDAAILSGKLPMFELPDSYQHPTKFGNPQQIRDHFVELRDGLYAWNSGFDSSSLADLCGVKRQTFYQYGFQPTSRGARVIPAAALDRMRVEFVKWRLSRLHIPAFLPRDEYTWIVKERGEVIRETTQGSLARFEAAVSGGRLISEPGPKCCLPAAALDEGDRRSQRWLEIVHSGFVDADDTMQITGLGRHDVGTIGLTAMGWGVEPTRTWLRKAEALWAERYLQNAS